MQRYDAKDGYVFDWKDLESHQSPEIDPTTGEPTGRMIQEHLYAKTLFIGKFDSIDNYVEVPEPNKED